MLNFNELDERLNHVLEGKAPSDIFYSEVFQVLVQLKASEQNHFIERLQNLSKTNATEYGRWLALKGMSALFGGKYPESCTTLKEGFDVFKELDDLGGIMATSCLISTCYRSMGQLDNALKYKQEALQAEAKLNDEKIFRYFNCVTFYQAGELAGHLKNYDQAIDYYKQGIKYIDGNPEFEGRLLSGIGNVLLVTDQWKDAISHFEKALKVVLNYSNVLLLSKIYADIGNYYVKSGDFKRALENEKLSLDLRLENNFINPAITNYIHLAEIYLGLGEYADAIHYGEKAVEQAKKLNVIIKLYEAHRLLSLIYEKTGNVEKAYEHFKQYHQIQNEVINQESIRKVEQMQSQFQMEKLQQEKEIVHLRNVELKSAMDEIHESIRYAKRIQNAILPSDSLVKKYLPESFIYYLPKDIVAGDFYFMERVKSDRGQGTGEVILLAVCDCTGHGVPGALVSVVCSNALNRSIHEYGITDPGKILDQTREIVIREFEKSDDDVKDGMDVSLLAFAKVSNNENGERNSSLSHSALTLQWAGANNPLWIIRNKKLIEYKGNKQPVGKFLKNENFISHRIEIEKGDCIYLFSDGVTDQFGGERGKKFTANRLSEFLISISDKPMDEQKSLLQNCFSNWQGNHEQVDDVCVVGIRI